MRDIVTKKALNHFRSPRHSQSRLKIQDLRVLFAGEVCIGTKIANRRNTYEIEVGFFYHLLDADVWNDVSAFCESPDNTENPVHLQAGQQFGGVHDEPRRIGSTLHIGFRGTLHFQS